VKFNKGDPSHIWSQSVTVTSVLFEPNRDDGKAIWLNAALDTGEEIEPTRELLDCTRGKAIHDDGEML